MVTRKLFETEKAIVRSVYGDNIDVDLLKVTNVDIVPFQKWNSVTPFNTIHLSDKFSDLSDLSLKPEDQAHLIHEAWHAYEWQTQGIKTVIKSVLEQIGHQLGARVIPPESKGLRK